MARIIESIDLPDGLADHAMAATWIAGANARASRVAPCLASTSPAPTDDQLDEARLVLIGAIVRWSQTGSGAFQSKTVGPMSVTVDTRQRGGFNLWPSEITQLQEICKNGSESKAFSIDTVSWDGYHAQECSIYFGGDCSCGASIAGQPIYGQ